MRSEVANKTNLRSPPCVGHRPPLVVPSTHCSADRRSCVQDQVRNFVRLGEPLAGGLPLRSGTVDQGTTDLDALRVHLDSRRLAEIRAVADNSTEPPRIMRAVVIVGQKTLQSPQRWNYGAISFHGDVLTSKQISSILVASETQEIQLGGTPLCLEFQAMNFTWQRKPSLAQYDQRALAWPSTLYEPRLETQQHFNLPGYLVGAGDAPSFPTFGTAFNAFMYGNFSLTGTGNPSIGEFSIRVIDQRARIQRVRIRPTSLDVTVGGGRTLKDSFLEFNSISERQTVGLVKSGKVSFLLPAGLPPDSWVWLKADTEWLDYRPLNNWGGHRSQDVEFDLPEDPEADLSRLVTQGEGQHLEYKSKLPDTRDEKRHVFKTVAAFANGDGGTIAFGVSDDGRICGLPEKVQASRARLNDLIRDLVSPTPRFRIESHNRSGRNVLLLKISENDGSVYGLILDANKPEYYVRRDGTTYYARPDEIESIVQRGVLQQGYPAWAGGG